MSTWILYVTKGSGQLIFQGSGSLGAKWGFPTTSTSAGYSPPAKLTSDLPSALPEGLLGQYPGIVRILCDKVPPLYQPLYGQVLAAVPTDLTIMDIGVVRYFSHVAWDCASKLVLVYNRVRTDLIF